MSNGDIIQGAAVNSHAHWIMVGSLRMKSNALDRGFTPVVAI